MKQTVGTSAVELNLSSVADRRDSGLVLIVQNLGPGALYLDFANTVSAATSLKIGVNGSYEFPRMSSRNIWVIADQADTDVRYLGVD